jgi:hypothetical protein
VDGLESGAVEPPVALDGLVDWQEALLVHRRLVEERRGEIDVPRLRGWVPLGGWASMRAHRHKAAHQRAWHTTSKRTRRLVSGGRASAAICCSNSSAVAGWTETASSYHTRAYTTARRARVSHGWNRGPRVPMAWNSQDARRCPNRGSNTGREQSSGADAQARSSTLRRGLEQEDDVAVRLIDLSAGAALQGGREAVGAKIHLLARKRISLADARRHLRHFLIVTAHRRAHEGSVAR